MPSPAVIFHSLPQWQTRGQATTMGHPTALRIPVPKVLRRRPEQLSRGHSHSMKRFPTHPSPRSRPSIRVGPPTLYLRLVLFFCISEGRFHSLTITLCLGVLPSPSIGSASPAPPVNDLIPGTEFAALNQEALSQDHPSKRLQQMVSQVQHLLERGNIPELYVTRSIGPGFLLTV